MPSISRFKITASPCLAGEHEDELTHVDFNANDSQGDQRIWQVSSERLASLFDVINPNEAANDIITKLNAGHTVTLPGSYSAVDLVQLGFRNSATKSVRRKPRSPEAALFGA